MRGGVEIPTPPVFLRQGKKAASSARQASAEFAKKRAQNVILKKKQAYSVIRKANMSVMPSAAANKRPLV